MSTEFAVDYGNSALIVWDMQNGIASRAFNLKEIVSNINLMIDACRRKGIPVIFSQQTKLPYEFQSKYSTYMEFKRGRDPKSSTHMAEGSESWQFIKEMIPAKDDIILKKHTPDFFIGTILEQMLRNRNVKTVILGGVSTEVGIVATVRHAAYTGFFPVVAEDAVGSADQKGHEMALELMRKFFEVRGTKEIIQKIESI